MRTLLIFLAVTSLGGVFAQNLAGYHRLGTPQAVGATLYTASREILIISPSLRSKDIAEALRKSALERGVTIFVIADALLVDEPAGYLGGLSLLKNVHVRLVQGLTSSRAIIDRTILVSGSLLFDVPNPLESKPTFAATDPQATSSTINWFNRVWRTAAPYKYKIQTPTR
jgi:sugar-specific transcriptional regulator TrmB